jgi:hypothetical protein
MPYKFKPSVRPYGFKSGMRRSLAEKRRRQAQEGQGLVSVNEACAAYYSITRRYLAPASARRMAREHRHLACFDLDGRLRGIRGKRWAYFVRTRESV